MDSAYDGLDLVDAEPYASGGYPHDQWTRLRREAPLSWFEPDGYRGFWAVTKHADVCEISKQPELFSSEPRLTILDRQREQTQSIATQMRTIVNMDPPDHRTYRALASPWFTPRNLRVLEERMVESARSLVDGMAEAGDAEIDFVPTVAALHPLRLIAHLFGLDEADEPFVLRATNEMFGAQDPEFQRDGDAEAAAVALRDEFFAFFARIAQERRGSPGDDLASVLASATVGDRPIPELELLSYYLIVLTAGHETTRNALSGGLLALIEHPDQLHALRDDIGLAASAADEIVRWTTPVNHFARTATRDYEMRGQTIRKGESVALFYASANRDEEIFEDPFVFRVDRSPNPHLGFGIGEHFCLGATLARMEIRVLLEELVPRLEGIEVVGEVSRLASSFVGGVKHLPIRCRIGHRSN